MKETIRQAARLMELLPETEQHIALEFIKKLVKTWDPDYTKVSSMEAKRLKCAEESGYLDGKNIDWNCLKQYLKK